MEGVSVKVFGHTLPLREPRPALWVLRKLFGAEIPGCRSCGDAQTCDVCRVDRWFFTFFALFLTLVALHVIHAGWLAVRVTF